MVAPSTPIPGSVRMPAAELPWGMNTVLAMRRTSKIMCTSRFTERAYGACLGFALVVVFSLTACGPRNGELASPPVGVTYSTGDMQDTIDGQLGLTTSGPAAKVEGGLGFSRDAVVSCGPRDGSYRLRFRPLDGSGVTLTLLLPEKGHGGHGSGHGEPSAKEPGAGHAAETATQAHDGEPAEAVVTRIENGRLVESVGTARVRLRAATRVAGRHAVSGDFTAEVSGEAGSATLEGRFDRCFYLPG